MCLMQRFKQLVPNGKVPFLTNSKPLKRRTAAPERTAPACYESVVISYGIVNLPHGLKLSRLFGGLTLQR